MATEQEKQKVTAILEQFKNPCIVELGAHTGEEENWFSDAAQGKLRHIMVEPDTRNVKHLLDKPTGTDRRVIIAAVSRENGTAEFHFSDNPRENNHASGSLKRPTGHLEHLPWISFPHTGMVQTITLDTLFEWEKLDRIDLLWVDIQGAEKDMLAGGTKALEKTRYIFMEAEDIELYEGEALKPELIALLPGWTLVEDFGSNILLRNDHFVEGEIGAAQPDQTKIHRVEGVERTNMLVGLMPVRNEAWCLELTLRAALEWCDAVVVLDHASNDGSSEMIHWTAHEGRIYILEEPDPAWDEMRHRQRMLETARSIGATHIAMIDADEILSRPVAKHIRDAIFHLPDHVVLQCPWIILRGSFRRYHANGLWSNRWVSMAFKDSPEFSWQGDQFHHREPFGKIEQFVRFAGHENGGVLHLWGVSERRLRAKHALYKMTERIRWPEKNVALIDGYYNLWQKPQPGETWDFANVPEEWWEGYDLSHTPEFGAVPWQAVECRRLVALFGVEYFAGLDLFGVLATQRRPLRPLFSLCHATARFPEWMKAADAWFKNTDHPELIEYLLAIHADDLGKVSGHNLPRFGEGASVVVNDLRSCSVDNWNKAARLAKGQILINVADDWFPCEHWDSKLLELLPDLYAEAAIDVDTLSTGYPVAHSLMPFSIITRPYLERLQRDYDYDGFFYPGYTSMYSDEEFTWLARRDGVVIEAWQHVFEHRHPVHGKAAVDAVYRKQNAKEHYVEGKKLMDRRLAEFGITLVRPIPQKPKLLICAPGEHFSREWVAHWSILITTLEKTFDMDADGTPGIGTMFSYSTNVYVTRSSMLEEMLRVPLKPDLVLWLDDDNLVKPKDVYQLAQDLEDHPELDAVAGWCFLERSGGFCISAGHFDESDQLNFMTYSDLQGKPDPLVPVDGTGFPVILMRYRLIEKVGRAAFHPRFSEFYRWGFSGEDISFCLRAREVGAKLAIDRRVEVPHLKLGIYRPATTATTGESRSNPKQTQKEKTA